jgi:serine/threonine protein kinase
VVLSCKLAEIADATTLFDMSTPGGLTPITTQGQKSFGGAGEQYELEEVLGEGSYGSVYRCCRSRDSAVFAVKVIDPLRLGFVGGSRAVSSAEAMAVREVDALRRLASHPGIISLEAGFFSEATRQIFIVTDFCPGSHVFAHVVQRYRPLQESEAAHIVAQVADALCFCHSLGVVHRDLKLENVLVANVNVSLVEVNDGDGLSWRTQELFSVKICDFGFAKCLQGYTTRTPVGTHTYAAPEVKGEDEEGVKKTGTEIDYDAYHYDAFKADAYSVGVMIFVMLCLGFPVKGGGEGSHRNHKLWPTLSEEAKHLIDGLLEFDPLKRMGVIEVFNHFWVSPNAPDSPKARERRKKICEEAEGDDSHWESSRRSPTPRWRMAEDPILPGILALHRALVHIQQERGMALWALAGAPGLDGISCWDQFKWHVQLTEKRIHLAKGMLEKSVVPDGRAHLESKLVTLASSLTKARQMSHGVSGAGDAHEVPPTMVRQFTFDSDAIFLAYNQAGKALIAIVTHSLENAHPGSSEGRRAARRYMLFSAAAEQLARERAFMCGHTHEKLGVARHVDSDGSPRNAPSGVQNGGRLPREKLQKLSEIIGSRKILLGTAAGDTDVHSNYTVATSTGLLGGLVGDAEPALLSPADIAELESLEARVLAPDPAQFLPTEEWYRTLTRLLNEIHSRIAITLVDDLRVPDLSLNSRQLPPCSTKEAEQTTKAPEKGVSQSEKQAQDPKVRYCGCRAGLKQCLQSIVDSL